MLRVGIDVGGTFTDIVAVDGGGRNLSVRKTPSTRNQAEGILTGLSGIADDLQTFVDISHGTTVATNMLLEGKGARMALVSTLGFRDAVEIGRCRRLVPSSIFDLKFVRPAPLVPRKLRFEVPERIASDGRIITPLDTARFDAVVRAIEESHVEAVAICFINSYVNPAHEQLAKRLLEEHLPDVFVCCSSEVIPQIREYERFSTATVNCAVAPVMSRYMKTLIASLRSRGYKHDVYTMASNAGLLTSDMVVATPVRTILSGPAAAVNGALYIGNMVGRRQLITYDMGGTSTDVCLIDRGDPLVTADTVLAGIPVSVPQLDIHTVGTGGGSIAWVDVDGAPRVGPRSAGSEPGPIAYGKGGTEITVTDANLLLGRLPGHILGGAMALSAEPVSDAFDRFVARIGFTGAREDLAEGLIRLAVATMAGTVRKISIERGHDPRDFSIFAIGGAGPMHAALVADELEIREVLVPPMPGNISAFGHLVGELKYDAMRTFHALLEEFHQRGGPDLLAGLGRQARQRLDAGERPARSIKTRYYADLRYVGQSYEITVPIALPFTIARMKSDFVTLYRKRYGHQHNEPVEFTALKAVCSTPKGANLRLDFAAPKTDALAYERQVYFSGKWHRTKVVPRARMPGRQHMSGPLIVEEYGATTVVPPGWKARAGHGGCLFLMR